MPHRSIWQPLVAVLTAQPVSQVTMQVSALSTECQSHRRGCHAAGYGLLACFQEPLLRHEYIPSGLYDHFS